MNRWFSPRDLQAPGTRLFCLPHAGSGAAGFYQWKRLLPPAVAVCPALLPGREVRIGESAPESVQAIVAGLQEAARLELERPYAIFGHSMGALLAFEWARTIEHEGLRPPEYLFVSGRNAPQASAAPRDLHYLDDRLLLEELQLRYGGAQARLLHDPEMSEVFLPILRADLKVVESYDFVPGPMLRCPLEAVAGTKDRSVSETGLEGWSAVTSSRCEVRRIEGDHFYTLDVLPGGGRSTLLKLLLERMQGQAL